METNTENKSSEQGYGFVKSLAIVFGVTAIIVGAIIALKFMLG